MSKSYTAAYCLQSVTTKLKVRSKSHLLVLKMYIDWKMGSGGFLKSFNIIQTHKGVTQFNQVTPVKTRCDDCHAILEAAGIGSTSINYLSLLILSKQGCRGNVDSRQVTSSRGNARL